MNSVAVLKQDDRWEYITRVVCIREYKTLKLKSHYDIKGRGNLQFNTDPNVGGRTGYGFCIKDPNSPLVDTRSGPSAVFSSNPIWYYFTIKEMDEYFITEDEDYKIETRDRKIKDLGI